MMVGRGHQPSAEGKKVEVKVAQRFLALYIDVVYCKELQLPGRQGHIFPF